MLGCPSMPQSHPGMGGMNPSSLTHHLLLLLPFQLSSPPKPPVVGAAKYVHAYHDCSRMTDKQEVRITDYDQNVGSWPTCACRYVVGRCAAYSNTHGHDDVAVFVVVAGVFGAHLARGLGVLELEADLAGVADGFEEVEHVGGVEADDQSVELIGRFDGVFGFAGLGGGAGDAEFVLLQAQLDGAGALVGELRHALDGAG